jgi:diguanylate cyclase (GGDEF)-like protein
MAPSILMFIAALLAGFVFMLAWRRRSVPGSPSFILLMAAVGIYAFFAALENAAASESYKILWSKLSYLGIVNLGPLWLMFAFMYSHPQKRAYPRWAAWLWLVPFLTLGLVLTNEWHHLIWSSYTFSSTEPGARLVYGHGLVFWIHAFYVYLLMLLGTILLIRSGWRSPRPFRRQVTLIVLASLVPWMGNAMYIFKLTPWPGLDLTPIAFVITGLLLAESLYRFRAFDLMPVAREVVFNNLGAGVLVIDSQNRLVDINPMARKWTGLGNEAIGKNPFIILPEANTLRQFEQVPEVQTVLEIENDNQREYYNMTISPIRNELGQLQGRVVLLYDTSREHELLEAQHRRNAQLSALQSVSQAVTSSLDLNQTFVTVVNVLHQTFGYRYISIYLLFEGKLQLGAQVGYPEEMIYWEIPIERGVMGRTVRTRQAQFIPEGTADPDYLRATYEVGSEICVPLMKEQAVLGTLNIESPPELPLTEADLQLLSTFAGQVAVAIDNANLFKAEREQRKLAEALREMGMTLSESLNLESVLSRLLDEVEPVVAYDRASVLLVDEERQRARITQLRSPQPEAQQGDRKTLVLEFEIGSAANLRKMMETCKPLVVTNTGVMPRQIHDPSANGYHSWAGAPILRRGEAIGFLSLDKGEINYYQPEHGALLAAFAGQAAVAIENARIFTEMQKGVEKERLLVAAVKDFTAGLDTEAVLQAIVRHMIKALKVDGCAILRWDPLRDCLVTLLDYDTDPAIPPAPPGSTYNQADYPLLQAVIDDRQPAFINLKDPEIDLAEADRMKKLMNEAILMLPLIIGREKDVFGMVKLFRKAHSIPFVKADLDLAQSFVAQAAIAIENARLYAETQHKALVDELTGLYNRRGLYELGKHEIERSIRFNHPMVALFLDIDHFKVFNDKYSYAVGDQVLRLFANCLRLNLREFDLVGRYGGEEFVVLLPEADLPAASEVAERVRSSVEALRVTTDQGETSITVSIGVCPKTPQLLDLDALIDRAGQAVHQSKEQGRNRVVIAEGSERDEIST